VDRRLLALPIEHEIAELLVGHAVRAAAGRERSAREHAREAGRRGETAVHAGFLAFSTRPVNRATVRAVLRELDPLAATRTAYAFAAALGLLWGSFANVCIYRWPPTEAFPRGRSVVRPGSHCFACKAPIRWYDNVPLASWLWLRGRCRACRAPFSP